MIRFTQTLAAVAMTLFAQASLAQPGHTRSLIPADSLSGWHADVPAADSNASIAPSFVARDHMLISLGSPSGHLITDAVYQNYRLDIEYRFSRSPGNCGILVHASTPRALYDMFPKSIEVQMHHENAGDFWCIGENIAVDNMADRRGGPPENWGGGPTQSRRILNLTDGSEHEAGQWNRMTIECLADRVRVWVNGDLVNDGFDCTAAEGHIAVQAEGTEVEFRRFDLTPIAVLSPAAAQPEPVRVYILSGQSNMEGKAQLKLLDKQIHAPETADYFAHLHADGKYIVRDDVWINFLNRHGGLSVGFGSPDRIGPELEFGNVVGDHYDQPVLLIKTAWGGKSLQRDFRPPGAGLPDDTVLESILQKTNNENAKHGRPMITIDDVKATYGHFYRAMLNEIHSTLSERDARFPSLKGRDVSIAGFVWFQGWNDQYEGAELEYAANMEQFIRDVRADLHAPNLPFVIGVMGQNGSTPATGPMLTIQNAQRAMEDIADFKGNVKAVRTDILIDTAAEALYPDWKQRRDAWEQVGSDHPYHYLGSAIWFSRIGRAFGEAVVELESARQHP